MRLTRPLALATAVAALTLLTAVPASAAPPALPDGWQLVNITCPSDSTAVIMTVDSATGASTPVASAPADAECGYSGAWDRVTGAAYFTSSDLTTSLLKYDSAMAIDLAGNAYILNDGGLYSLDLTTGVTTTVADLLEPTSYVYGFSVDPRTGDLYLLDEVGDLYLIDPSQAPGTGVDTFVASWSFPNGGSYTWGLAIDGNGTAWVTDNSSTIGYVSLLSVPLDSFGSATPEYSGELLEDGLYYDAWWVTLIPAPAPEPQLAATGLDVSTGLATGALVLLAGFGVVMVARRRTA
jgi:hypothetical protein